MSRGTKRESGGAKGARVATEAAPDSARGGKGRWSARRKATVVSDASSRRSRNNCFGCVTSQSIPDLVAVFEDNLLSLFCAQDIAHADGACFGFPSVSMSRAYLCSLAGFQVTTIGRFWVTAED